LSAGTKKEATKRRSDGATKGEEGMKARRREGMKKEATKRRSDEATKGEEGTKK